MHLFFVHFLECLIASRLLNFLPVSALCCLTIKVLLIKKRIVAVAERYLIITHVKNKESKKQPFNKKGRNLLVPSLQYCQFGQDDRKKNRSFSGR